jgi:hypothetical protein
VIMNFGPPSDEDHYPVRRRGEKRRLNPNAEGIAWLDRRAAEVTATTRTRLMDDRGVILPDNGRLKADFVVTRVYPRPRVDNHMRPMFQTFYVDTWSGTTSYVNPCPDCLNMAYSWSCPKHQQQINQITTQGWRVPQAPHIDLQVPLPVADSFHRDLVAWADSQGLTVAPGEES